jgi:hypothetical protein
MSGEIGRTHIGKCRTLLVFLHHLDSAPWLTQSLLLDLISSMSSIRDLDARILEAEMQITLLSQGIQELKTKRNALAPLGRLPDELLLRMARQAISQQAARGSPREVLYLMWICRRLRTLFVGCPQLWTQVDVSECHQVGFRTLLDRASSCPLDIFYCGHITKERCQALLECLPRAASLHLHEANETFETSQLGTQLLDRRRQCSMLQTLKITNVIAFPSLEQATLPNLVMLEIEDVIRMDILPHFPTLRTLKLKQAFCPLQVLHSFFSHAPLLESTALNYVMVDNDDDDKDFIHSSKSSQVRLPYLSHVEIEETPECILMLLRILPDLTMSFILRSSLSDSQEADWNSSPNGLLHQHMEKLWRKLPGATNSLPDSSIRFDGRGIHHKKLLVCFDGRGFSYRLHSWNPLPNEDSLLKNTRTLELDSIGCEDYDTEAMQDFIKLDWLPNVERVIISRLRSTSGFNTNDILSAERWISARSDEGRPLHGIVFRDCDVESRPLFDRLAAKQVASSIVWEESGTS